MRLLFAICLFSALLSGLFQLPVKLVRLISGRDMVELFQYIESPAMRVMALIGLGAGFIGYFVVVFAAVARVFTAVPFLRRAMSANFRNQPARRLGDGTLCLRHDSFIWSGGWLSLLFGFTGAAVAVVRGEPGTTAMVVCALLISAFGVYCIFAGHRSRLTFGEAGLRYVPAIGRAFSFTWPDVESVSFGRYGGHWILRLTGGRKAFVSLYMHGAMEFIRVLAQKSGVAIPPAVDRNGHVLGDTMPG